MKIVILSLLILFSTALYCQSNSVSEKTDNNQIFIFFENYEIERNELIGRLILPIIVFGIIIINALRSSKKSENEEQGDRKKIPIIFILFFTIIWSIVWYPSHISSFLNLNKKLSIITNIYENEQFEVTEGVIEVLFEQPHGGHAPGDKIKINNRTFEFSYFISNALYYHNTIAHDGLLIDGKTVKLHNFKGKIYEIYEVTD